MTKFEVYDSYALVNPSLAFESDSLCFKGKTYNFDNVDFVGICIGGPADYVFFGYKLSAMKTEFSFPFLETSLDDYWDLCKLINDQINLDKPAEQVIKFLGEVNHEGGLPQIPELGRFLLLTTPTEILLFNKETKLKESIPFNQIESYKLESNKEIQNRITVPRLLFLGIFALAVPKRTSTTTTYLTIDICGQNNYKTVAVFSSRRIAYIYKSLYEILSFSPSQRTNPELKRKIGVDETSIPKLILEYKGLLDLGVITQEEFEKKKAELLT